MSAAYARIPNGAIEPTNGHDAKMRRDYSVVYMLSTGLADFNARDR